MWLFSWNQNSDFYSQYEIGEQIKSLNGDRSIWTLFKAKKKSNKQPLSIFRVDFNSPSGSTYDEAKHFLKFIKTLRHPSILKYEDSCENEKSICIVTEAVTPLVEYLNNATSKFSQSQRDFCLSYGILNVAKGLKFMNESCKLNHNNINIHSIFVNNSGVWKIAGLEYTCPIEETPNYRSDTEVDKKYIPPERLDPTKVKHPGEKFAVDSWGLGCLVWECFNKPLKAESSLKSIGKMPRPLSVHYNKLVQTSPRYRVSSMDFIKNCQEANVFFNESTVETISSLEEIQLIKDPSEKARIFTRLEEELESFPRDILKNKILDDLINAFEYGEAGSTILNPIFKIGNLLDEHEYQNKLVPCIVKLYACKDRATRSKLLQQLNTYIGYLSDPVINDQVFPQVVQGFFDTNFTIREQTVKSMLHIAPKLNQKNLNDELLKHFSRLLARDEEGGIRANTTICLGKIAKHLSGSIQTTILLPTLLKVLRDPFPPARHAAIASLAANSSLFSDKDCVTKIMPCLCPLCTDTDLNVRRLAFKSLRVFLDRLEEESEKDGSSKTQATSGKATNTVRDHESNFNKE